MGKGMRFALKSTIAAHPHAVGKSRGEFSRAADEAGACACSSDVYRALKAQLAGGSHGCQEAVRSTPDRRSPIKAALTRETAGR